MTESQKKQLFKYKALAGLFLLMACIFITTTVLQNNTPLTGLAIYMHFPEATMVGALADWFCRYCAISLSYGYKNTTYQSD